jgi:hypothetical protein
MTQWATKNGRRSIKYCIIFRGNLNVSANPNNKSTTLAMKADIAKALLDFFPTAINRSFS